MAQQHNIATDGSLGAKVSLTGPNYAITAGLGKQVGGNLFHSFSNFGLDGGESAVFTGPAGITNVISRVTGGTLSSINGKIDSSAISGANFYLINPSGIVFGPNATVNVAGSFHAATADYLRLADGAKFQATNPSGSTLTAAAPAAFGFLNAAPPTITVNGSTLAVPAKATLGLVGGPGLTVGSDAASGSKAALTAPAGTIHLASVAGAGEVPVDPSNSAALTVKTFGAVSVKGGATLDVSDPTGLGSGGSVFIRAGALTIDASEINADDYGGGPGGGLLLAADSQITLTGGTNIHAIAQSSGAGAAIALATASGGGISVDGSSVQVGSQGAGAGGYLAVSTGTLNLTGGGQLVSGAQAGGSGGPVSIVADSVTLDGGAALDGNTGIFAKTSGSGLGGGIGVIAGRLGVRNGAGLLSLSFGAADGGSVATIVRGDLTVDSGGALGSAALAFGNAGSVAVNAGGAVAVDMSAAVDASILHGIGSLTMGPGRAGDLALAAPRLSLTALGLAASQTKGAGDSGDVAVNVSGPITITGGGVAAPDGTGILANAERGSSGNAGNIRVNAGTITITSSGGIGSPTFSTGNGGNVAVDVQGALSLDGTLQSPVFSSVIATAAGPGSSGNAGNVAVTAGSLSIVNGAQIFAGTVGSGNAGNVSVTVPGAVTLDGTVTTAQTGIVTASLGGAGSAGDVTVKAGSLSITNSAAIFSATTGPGNGGNIFVNAAGAVTLDGTSAAPGMATGILAPAVPGSSGNAGNVVVNSGSLSILKGASIADGTFGRGDGGAVSINVGGQLTIVGNDAAVSFAPETGQALTGIAADAVRTALSFNELPLITGVLTAAFPGATGNAGNIAVTAGALDISHNGVIFSPTFGPGHGGDVSARILGPLSITGTSQTGVVAENTSLPGTTGDAGNMTISAGAISLAGNGVISSHALAANGGSIAITANNLLHLKQGEITTQVDASTGNGGNITIDSPLVVLDRSAVTADAFGSGLNGNIDIRSAQFVQSTESFVRASGVLQFSNPPASLASSLVVLPSALRNPPPIRRDSCAARSALPRSSLTDAGRGGLPQDPEATLPALYFAGRDTSATTAAAAPPPAVAPAAATTTSTSLLGQGNLRVGLNCGV